MPGFTNANAEQRAAFREYERHRWEAVKYRNARRCWPIRHQLLPGAKGEYDRRRTWAEWFESLFGEPLTTYRERAKSTRIRRRLVALPDASVVLLSGCSPDAREREIRAGFARQQLIGTPSEIARLGSVGNFLGDGRGAEGACEETGQRG